LPKGYWCGRCRESGFHLFGKEFDFFRSLLVRQKFHLQTIIFKSLIYISHNKANGGSTFTTQLIVGIVLILVGYNRVSAFLQHGLLKTHLLKFCGNVGWLVSGVGILFFQSGIEIDPEWRAFRHCVFILGFRLGRWQSLVNPQRVLVTSERTRVRSWNGNINYTSKRLIYKVCIFSEKPYALLMSYFMKADDALKKAEEIAAELNLKLDNRIE
jgi:hypothetical protein